MSKHNELRDRINELCPELKKLEFGCEMIKKDELKDWAKLVTLISYDGKRSRGYFREQDGSIFSLITDFKKFEILGKDPTLEDVLMAISRRDFTSFQYKETKKGRIYRGSLVEILDLWELGKPLSQQSEETVEKILEILK